jgi:hypothetical protein
MAVAPAWQTEQPFSYGTVSKVPRKWVWKNPVKNGTGLFRPAVIAALPL